MAVVAAAYTSPVPSTYGKPIPKLYGLATVTGDAIWSNKPQASASAGGLLGSFAIAFGAPDPVAKSIRLLRLWFDGLLVYDTSGDTSLVALKTLNLSFYNGSETQGIDPTIQADKGALTPAYRGLIYAVIKDWDLTKSAGALPVVTAEIAQDSLTVFPLTQLSDPTQNYQTALIDYTRNTLLCINAAGTTLDIYDLKNNLLRSSFTLSDPVFSELGVRLSYENLVTYFWSPENALSNSDYIYLYDYSTGARLSTFGNDGGSLTSSDTNITNVVSFETIKGHDGFDEFFVAVTFTNDLYMIGRTGSNTSHRKHFNGLNLTSGYRKGGDVCGLHFKPYLNCNVLGRTFSIPTNAFSIGFYSMENRIGMFVLSKGDAKQLAVNGRALVSFAGRVVDIPSPCVGYVQTGIFDVITLAADEKAVLLYSLSSSLTLSAIILNSTTNTFSLRVYDTVFSLAEQGRLAIPFDYLADGSSTVIPDSYMHELTLRSTTDIPFVSNYDGYKTTALKSIRANTSVIGYSSGPNVATLNLLNGSSQVNDMSMSSFVDATDTTITFPGVMLSNRFVYDPLGNCLYEIVDGGLGGARSPARVLLGSTTPDQLNLGAFLISACLTAGYSSSDVSSAGLEAIYVQGAIINKNTKLIDLLSQVCELYRVDIVESAGKIKFVKRDRDTSLVLDGAITQADLAPIAQSADDGSLIDAIRDASFTLPSQVTVDYIDANNKGAIGTQTAKRSQFPVSTSKSQASIVLSVPIIMSALEALYWVTRCMFDIWNGATLSSVRLSQKWLALEPSDLVSITLDDGHVYEVKVEEVIINGDYSISAKMRTFAQFVTFVKPPAIENGNVDPGLAVTEPTPPLVIDNLLVDFVNNTDGTTIPYVWATENPCILYRYNTATTAYDLVSYSAAPIVVGYARNILAAPAWVFEYDTVNTLRVTLAGNVEFASTTEDAWLAGLNAVLVGNVGRWELIYFRDVVKNADNSFTLSHLLRGQRGSEMMAGTHKSGDYVIYSASGLTALTEDISRLNTTEKLKTVANGMQPNDPANATLSFLSTGGPLKPWAPVNLAALGISGDVLLTWNRRDRSGDDLHDGDDLTPLSEASEAYSVDIYKSGAIVRTLTSSTEAVTYTAAQQTADGQPSPMVTIDVAVYQISASVGRGYGTRKICNVG